MKIIFDKNKITIELEITLDCNINCNGCNRLCNLYTENKNSYMNVDDVVSIFNDFVKNNINIYRITIMGGEPTLNKKLLDIYNICKKYTHRVSIDTNGSNNSMLKNMNYYDSNNSKTPKYNFRNTYISPKEENQELKDQCDFPEKCGISISKINNKIIYCLCGCGKSISILTKNYNFLFKNIKDLMNMDMESFRNNICCHCQACAKNQIFIKDNPKISNCFKDGFNDYKNKIINL